MTHFLSQGSPQKPMHKQTAVKVLLRLPSIKTVIPSWFSSKTPNVCSTNFREKTKPLETNKNLSRAPAHEHCRCSPTTIDCKLKLLTTPDPLKIHRPINQAPNRTKPGVSPRNRHVVAVGPLISCSFSRGLGFFFRLVVPLG